MRFHNFQIFAFLLGTNYNGYIGLIYTYKYLGSDDEYQKFSMFSYINSTDSELLREFLKEFEEKIVSAFSIFILKLKQCSFSSSFSFSFSFFFVIILLFFLFKYFLK